MDECRYRLLIANGFASSSNFRRLRVPSFVRFQPHIVNTIALSSDLSRSPSGLLDAKLTNAERAHSRDFYSPPFDILFVFPKPLGFG